jgi:deoxyuridine 5'-triphosphate nucleotidohydrolase
MNSHIYIPIELKILDSRIEEKSILDAYATEGSAGMDLIACIDEPLILKEGKTALIPSGIAIHIKDPMFVSIILPRSGLGHKKGLVLGNLTGVIDSDYQGQIFISAWNRNQVEIEKIHRPDGGIDYEQIDHSVTINPGDRIAQLLIVPVMRARFKIVSEFEETKRGDGGFGHTGVSSIARIDPKGRIPNE